jgi:hypothetical protein
MALIMVVGGLLCVLYPSEGAFVHESGRYTGPAAAAYRTKTADRVFGACAVLFGAGFGALLLRQKK